MFVIKAELSTAKEARELQKAEEAGELKAAKQAREQEALLELEGPYYRPPRPGGMAKKQKQQVEQHQEGGSLAKTATKTLEGYAVTMHAAMQRLEHKMHKEEHQVMPRWSSSRRRSLNRSRQGTGTSQKTKPCQSS